MIALSYAWQAFIRFLRIAIGPSIANEKAFFQDASGGELEEGVALRSRNGIIAATINCL